MSYHCGTLSFSVLIYFSNTKRSDMNKAINLYLTLLRNKKTEQCKFQRTAHIVADLLAQQALLHLNTKSISIDTPIAKTTGIELTDEIVLVAILRSGITMLPAFLHYFPGASIGIIGLKRDEKTAEAHLYYQNLPPLAKNLQIIIIDPMLATGGTGIITISLLCERTIQQNKILFVSIVSAPEGIKKINNAFPGVTIITAAEDEKLNAKKFIVPGLGDFGDRYFGTEE